MWGSRPEPEAITISAITASMSDALSLLAGSRSHISKKLPLMPGVLAAIFEPVSSDSKIAANTPGISGNFFEMWLRDPANKDKASDIEAVIADMVMASGSGLDPHITLRNALSVYQLDRVAA